MGFEPTTSSLGTSSGRSDETVTLAQIDTSVRSPLQPLRPISPEFAAFRVVYTFAKRGPVARNGAVLPPGLRLVARHCSAPTFEECSPLGRNRVALPLLSGRLGDELELA